jgi:hypothetical protein
MNIKMLKSALAGLVLSVSGFSNAGIIPFGVQDDISISTVTNDWGWSLCHQETYSTVGTTITNLFDNCTGDYVMLASGLANSSILDVAAAALFSAVTTYTAQNNTHLANGVEWYHNGGSLGFAPQGATIYQNSADVNASGLHGGSAIDSTSPLRLSWHTAGGYESNPTQLNGGWRSGSNTGLNSAQNWNRYVFTANAPSSVPEPSTLAIFALGIMGLASRRSLLVKKKQ